MGPSIPVAQGSKALYLIIILALGIILVAGALLILSQGDQEEDEEEYEPGLLVEVTGTLDPDHSVTYSVLVRQDPIADRSNISAIVVTDSLNGSIIEMVDLDQNGFDDGDDLQDGVLQYGEVWNFTILFTIPDDAEEPLQNMVDVVALDEDGDVISANASVSLMFKLKLGDSFQYRYSGYVEGVMWLNVTEVGPTSYTCSVTFYHDNITEEPGPWFFGSGDLISPFGPNPTANWWEQDLVGTEEIVTALGERTVRHYRNTTTDSSWDMYTALNMNIMYRYQRTMESNPLLVELVETNIIWL